MAPRSYEQAKGRRSKKTGAWLPTEVLESRAYRELTSGAKNLLIAIAAQYRGKGSNNGDLSIAIAVLRKYGISSPGLIWRAAEQLAAHGLIVLTRRGMKMKDVPTLIAVTWQPVDACDGKIHVAATHVSSNLWRQYAGHPLGTLKSEFHYLSGTPRLPER